MFGNCVNQFHCCGSVKVAREMEVKRASFSVAGNPEIVGHAFSSFVSDPAFQAFFGRANPDITWFYGLCRRILPQDSGLQKFELKTGCLSLI